MILNTITLHNFMSYGDATLDLSPCTVACLSGSNGAGKSAILDAITWAIWECARSTSDELIRADEHDMWVDMTFELEGHLYRIRRARQRVFARGGGRVSSKGSLEFQIRKNSTDAWQSLSAANMRDTQTRICEVLRMDYDTFINSVYLRQGRADEFTTRPPAERKQVLSEILGLSYFDKLQELAKEKARQRKARVDVLQSGLQDAAEIEKHLKQARSDFDKASKQLEEKRNLKGKNATAAQALQDEIAHCKALELQIEPTKLRVAEIIEEIDALQQKHAVLTEREQSIATILETVTDAESVSKRFRELRNKVEKLDETSMRRQEFDTRRLELKSQLANARGRMEVELEHLLLKHKSVEESLAHLQQQLGTKEKLSEEYGQYKRLLHQENEMAQKQEAFTLLTARAEQLHTAIVEARFYLEAQFDQQQKTLAELTELMKSRDSLDGESDDLQQQLKALETAEVEFENVEEHGVRLKHEIDAIELEIIQLRKQQSDNHHKRDELSNAQSLSMCPLCAAPIVDRAAVFARYSSLHEQIDGQITELESKKATLNEKRSELRQKYVELKRKLDTRKALDVRIGEFNARKAALDRADENHRQLAAAVKLLEEKLAAQSFAEVERESLIGIKTEIHKLEYDPVLYSGLQAQIRARRHLDIRFQQLKKDEVEFNRLREELPAVAAQIENLKEALQTNNYAPEVRTEIVEMEERLAEFPYDKVEHQQLKQELATLLPIVDKLKDIETALAERPQLAKDIVECAAKLEARRSQLAQLEQSIATWATRIDKLPDLESRKQQLDEEAEVLENELQRIDREAVVLHSQIKQSEEKLLAFEKQQQQITTLITEANDYGLLAEAFGKKGIQAVIIENAVPEIESEANRILSRLSENQMHVALITQQRTKQGNITETLEIVIADQIGTRSYELYSGGEAFKINFAIRLALSRLLARRAGAKLQTLIIDEGFGSQDEASRGRLVNAINAIRTDFARILIVTHIAEIKDLFPVQIQVQKDNGISSVSLVHAF